MIVAGSHDDPAGLDQAVWRPGEVASPLLDQPVPVVVARDIPYMTNANRFQNLSIYLPRTPESSSLVGHPAEALPGSRPEQESDPASPRYYVHIHGGAWRDPQQTSRSIEPTVAHAYSGAGPAPFSAIVSLNYSLSQYPTHPRLPYDAIKDNHCDPAREAVHPQHVSDVLHGLALLRSFGLANSSYLLSGHSCGACIALQILLQPPRHYGLGYLPEAPCPVGVLGINGLYDLPELATTSGLGESHAHLRDDYDTFLSNAFGPAKSTWPAASPARFEPPEIAERVHAGKAPRLVVLDQSAEDELVPMNQRQRLQATLRRVPGLSLLEGQHCTGAHSAPWERGDMIWHDLQDILALLARQSLTG
jgi:kynurenine formamidase